MDTRQPPLTDFHKFEMLPVELQDEVWKCYVVQNPQIMTLPPMPKQELATQEIRLWCSDKSTCVCELNLWQLMDM